ncbi:hypothetical protein VTO73DRAFT_13936 [Trametes versicolor]
MPCRGNVVVAKCRKRTMENGGVVQTDRLQTAGVGSTIGQKSRKCLNHVSSGTFINWSAVHVWCGELRCMDLIRSFTHCGHLCWARYPQVEYSAHSWFFGLIWYVRCFDGILSRSLGRTCRVWGGIRLLLTFTTGCNSMNDCSLFRELAKCIMIHHKSGIVWIMRNLVIQGFSDLLAAYNEVDVVIKVSPIAPYDNAVDVFRKPWEALCNYSDILREVNHMLLHLFHVRQVLKAQRTQKSFGNHRDFIEHLDGGQIRPIPKDLVKFVLLVGLDDFDSFRCCTIRFLDSILSLVTFVHKSSLWLTLLSIPLPMLWQRAWGGASGPASKWSRSNEPLHRTQFRRFAVRPAGMRMGGMYACMALLALAIAVVSMAGSAEDGGHIDGAMIAAIPPQSNVSQPRQPQARGDTMRRDATRDDARGCLLPRAGAKPHSPSQASQTLISLAQLI